MCKIHNDSLEESKLKAKIIGRICDKWRGTKMRKTANMKLMHYMATDFSYGGVLELEKSIDESEIKLPEWL